MEFHFLAKIMEKSWKFVTGLRQRRKINAAKWLEWQMFYIQESLLSEQAIDTVFVNICCWKTQQLDITRSVLFAAVEFFPKCTVIAIAFKASQCNGCATLVEKNGTRVTVYSEQVVI